MAALQTNAGGWGQQMFSEMRHHLELRKLQAKRRKVQIEKKERTYDELPYGNAGSGGIRRALREWEQALAAIDRDIAHLMTEHLLEQAQKYLIFVPEEPANDDERLESLIGFRTLSPEAILRLRTDIRKERKERWEHWQVRISLVIGLLGALIGVVSLLKK